MVGVDSLIYWAGNLIWKNARLQKRSIVGSTPTLPSNNRRNMTKNTGRLKDVYFEDIYVQGQDGSSTLSRTIVIYADKDKLEYIKSVDGVLTAGLYSPEIPNYYYAVIDPRYDRKFVVKEIEAAILCNIRN